MFDVLIKSHDIDKRVIDVVLYMVFPLSFQLQKCFLHGDTSSFVKVERPIYFVC